MSKKKTIIKLIAGFSLLSCFATSFSFSQKANVKNATPNKMGVFVASSETELGSDYMKVRLTNSTKTDLCQSFGVSFVTGGKGWQNSSKNLSIMSDDASFDTYYEEWKALSQSDQEEIGEVIFSSHVQTITGQKKFKNVVIPKRLYFYEVGLVGLEPTYITDNVVTDSDYTNITSIKIPTEIATISSDSFAGIEGSGVVFNCEANEKPAGWADDWNHGCTVNWGVEYTEDESYIIALATPLTIGKSDNNYFLGYVDSSENINLPLTFEYSYVGETETHSYAVPHAKDNVVGLELSTYSTSITLDIDLESADKEIDASTLKVSNIIKAVNNGGYEPDVNQLFYAYPSKGYSKVLNVEDFITMSFKSVSSFAGYTNILTDVKITNPDIYQSLKTSYYKEYKNKIEDGSVYIRYRTTAISSGSIEVTYLDKSNNEVTERLKISTPVAQVVYSTSSVGHLSYTFKNSRLGEDYNYKRIREINYIGLYVTIDLYGSNGPIARSGTTTRFGVVSMLPHADKAPSSFNADLFITLEAIIYVIGFIGVTVGLYFYLKNKYKNDEFRRMKTKQYVKKGIIGLVGSTIVVLALTFIILRTTALNNTIVGYNPVDAFIIIFGAVSIVIIGYFIKYLVTVIKAEKERRRTIKLKLNEDVVDDGTK